MEKIWLFIKGIGMGLLRFLFLFDCGDNEFKIDIDNYVCYVCVFVYLKCLY